MKEYTIIVTKKDIDKGWPGASNGCAIARSCCRKFKTREVDVALGYEKSKKNNVVEIKGIYYSLPRAAMNFIRKFDEGEDVKPIKFKIKEIENNSWRQGS